MRRSYLFTTLLSVLVSTGCSSNYAYQLNFDRTYPLRVAVLPFYSIEKSGEYTMGDGSIALDGIPFISDEGIESPAEFFRSLVQNEINDTALDLVAPNLIDLNLSHSGLTKPSSLALDLERIIALPQSEVCSKILSCDAVLYGKVLEWDRSYYGLQSVSSVGLEIKLVSAKTGDILYTSTANDYESRGLLKGPTGFSDLVVAPISGLDGKIIADLARQMVAKMVLPLKMADKKELDETTPPAIFAATHDSLTPYFARSDILTVLMFATSAGSASFSIGDVVRDIPMIERSPGHYVGEYYPGPRESFSRAPVAVRLLDRLGRQTQLVIGRGAITLE